MHGVFALDQVVDRLAVDDNLGHRKGGPREHRSGDTLAGQARSEVKGCDRQRATPLPEPPTPEGSTRSALAAPVRRRTRWAVPAEIAGVIGAPACDRARG